MLNILFSEQPSLILCFIEVQEKSMVENIILKLNLIVVEKTQLISKYEFIKNCFVPLYSFFPKTQGTLTRFGVLASQLLFSVRRPLSMYGSGSRVPFPTRIPVIYFIPVTSHRAN